jgi:hypothetical protein
MSIGKVNIATASARASEWCERNLLAGEVTGGTICFSRDHFAWFDKAGIAT